MMNPDTSAVLKPRRGRSPKVDRQFNDTRQALIRSGLEVLTETGYLAAGIEAVIRNIDVSEGPFYHRFESKETFGLAVLSAHGNFFAHKSDKSLLDDAVPLLGRMAALMRYAGQGMEKYQFRRGYLVGSLLQEAPLLPDTFPGRLRATLTAWELHVVRRLHGARAAGAITRDASPDALAQVFWVGWEGVVMRARLCQSTAPPDQYWEFFAYSMTAKTPAQDGASADNPPPTRNALS